MNLGLYYEIHKTNKDKSTELYKKGQQKVQLCTLPLKELLLRTQQSKENYLFINNNLFNPTVCVAGMVAWYELTCWLSTSRPPSCQLKQQQQPALPHLANQTLLSSYF